jgi:hypothetical protein
MTTSPAPINNQVVDESGLPTLPWTLFFNQAFEGDAGNGWDPNFVSLTGSTSSITGRFYRLSQYIVFFSVNIVPDGLTSAAAGTTYIDNFPLLFSNDGFNTVVSGTGGGAIGSNERSSNRIYVPGWTNISIPLVVLGMVEAT